VNIANNILKHSLQNVYFLTGTALAGKTTMSKALAKKHGFAWLDENYNGEPFKKWESICSEKYQPLKHERDKRHKEQEHYDWDIHFNRPVEEIIAEQSGRSLNDEFMEFVVVELIKLSQNNKVIADVCMPIEMIVEISEYNRIACLLAAPHLVTTMNYGSRNDHESYLKWMLSLNEAEKKIKTNDEIFKIQTLKTYDEVEKHGLFKIIRTEDSTIERTLALLEQHFGI